MATQAEIEGVRRALNRLSERASGEWRAVWDSLSTGDKVQMRRLLARPWLEIVGDYGDMASALGVDAFEAWAEELGIVRPDAQSARGVDVDRASARMRWAIEQPDILGSSLVLLDELVKQPYRSTMQDSAWASGAGWARVPAGSETCAFCLMLASRGGVYSSKEISKFGLKGKKYHGDCDCVPALVRGPQDYPKGYDPDAMYDAYLLARDKAETTSTPDILSALRAQRGTH